MQLQMTERDKKLIVFLAIFVIFVAGGYWGIYPAITGIISTNEQITAAQAQKDQNEIKIAQIPLLEAENENIKEVLKNLRGDYFPMMNSAEVDRYLTGLILDYDLYAYDLDITMPAGEAQVEPYQYSAKAMETPESADESVSTDAVEETAAVHADGSEGETVDMTPETFQAEDVSSGIYEVAVSMRIGGDEQAIQRLIDELSAADRKLQLTGYSWGEQNAMAVQEDGSYELAKERTMTMSINLYMCED